MTPDGLKAEIQAGQLAAELAPFVAAGDDTQVAVILNDKRFEMPTGIPRAAFSLFAGKTNLRAAIHDHAADIASPLRSIALTLHDFLNGGTELHLSDPSSQQMLQAWVAAGAITPAQLAELNAMSTKPAGRSEVLFGQQISANDVSETRRA